MRIAAFVVLAGCGRFGFGQSAADAPATGDVATGDVAHDTTPPTADAFDQAAACTGFAVCDSFESPVFASVWTPDARVSLDTTHVHRGQQAVHAAMPPLAVGQKGYAQIAETVTVSGVSAPPTFYVRAWLYLSSLPAGMNHLELISNEGGGTTGDYTFAFSNDTKIYTQADGQVDAAGMPPPTNTWFCVIMKVTRGAASTGSVALTSDVLPSLSLPSATTDSSANPLSRVAVGLGLAATNVVNAQPAIDMWIDDVIVDPNMPTCAQ